MGIRRKSGHGDQNGRDDAADGVLGECDGLETVDCSNETHEEGLELALFLQLHDQAGNGLTEGEAWARLAYRNFRPHSITVRRKIAAPDAERVEAHDTAALFRLHAGRGRPPYYAQRVVDDYVAIKPGRREPDVEAIVTFDQPEDFVKKDSPEFVVQWPVRGSDRRCACCSRWYRM